MKNEECLERLGANDSDFASGMFSYFSQSADGYTVPVPMFVSIANILTGYKITHSKDQTISCASVFDNLSFLEPPVYMVSLLLLVLLIAIICLTVAARFHHSYSVNRIISTGNVQRRWTRLLTKTANEVHTLTRRRESTFKLISVLYSVLSFYLITSFMCLYKTSQVILVKPPIVTSYEQLLQSTHSVPIFYDVLFQVTDEFKNAVASSFESRVWQRLQRSPRAKRLIVTGDNQGAEIISLLRVCFSRIVNEHDVIIAKSLMVKMIKTLTCASSPESEKWRLMVFVDKNARESLLGYALSRTYTHPRYFSERMRILFESKLIHHYFDIATDASWLAYLLTGASKRHQQEQNYACSDEFTLKSQDGTPAITVAYFTSFVSLIAYFVAFSGFTLLLEMLSACNSRRKKLTRRLLMHRVY